MTQVLVRQSYRLALGAARRLTQSAQRQTVRCCMLGSDGVFNALQRWAAGGCEWLAGDRAQSMRLGRHHTTTRGRLRPQKGRARRVAGPRGGASPPPGGAGQAGLGKPGRVTSH